MNVAPGAPCESKNQRTRDFNKGRREYEPEARREGASAIKLQKSRARAKPGRGLNRSHPTNPEGGRSPLSTTELPRKTEVWYADVRVQNHAQRILPVSVSPRKCCRGWICTTGSGPFSPGMLPHSILGLAAPMMTFSVSPVFFALQSEIQNHRSKRGRLKSAKYYPYRSSRRKHHKAKCSDSKVQRTRGM